MRSCRTAVRCHKHGGTCRGGVAQSARKASKLSTGAGLGGGALLAASMLSTWHADRNTAVGPFAPL